jgi:exosortase H (IPTLxxWG-CTERM-specific)
VSRKPDRAPRPARSRGGAGASLRFLGLFVGLLALFQLLFVTLLADSDFFAAYMRLNARASAAILRWLGNDVQAVGDVLVSSPSSLAIKRGCDAVQPCGIFVAAILAFPAPWPAKIWAIAAGCLLLLLVNLLRIVSLYYASLHVPRAFELIHEAIWPAAFILLAFVFWMLWVQRLERPASRST